MQIVAFRASRRSDFSMVNLFLASHKHNNEIKNGPITSLEAVEGRSVQLPCDVSSPNPADKVYMVFWFKADTGIPLYSFDVRGMPLSKAHHNSAPEVFGSRAFFRTISEPATLVIDDIRRHDQGLYRCRVDFRNSATRSFRYNLTIIVPPEKPTLFDRWGRQLNGTLGPLDEGDDVMLTCRVIGGSPEPKVTWLVNGAVIDEEYEHNAGDVIENRLSWPSVSRKDLNSIFTCQATNTHLTDPQENSVVLDLRLRPLTIDMFATNSPLKAERRYDVVCVSTGSRPPAIISWYKANKQLRRVKEDVADNVTRSELTFIPSTEDNGKTVTCRAENPNVTGLFLETHWKVDVIFSPIVSLRLGSTLRAEDIKEGDDVYFECQVRANPPWTKLTWLHNGAAIGHNASAKVIRSHHSLVLQRITKHSAGVYSCMAANSQGESYSNELSLRIKYAPSCRQKKPVVIGASRSETLDIVCEIDADPPAEAFRWKFNNSGETLVVGTERFISNGTTSVLRYTPVADLDYGTLSCLAQNAIGLQSVPCIFQLVAAGKPQSVQNCTLIDNQKNSSVEIKCSPGYNGGIPQMFLLQMYTPLSPDPIYNITTSDEPVFHLNHLQSDVTFKIVLHAINTKGKSPPVILEEFSFKDPEKRTASDGLQIDDAWFTIIGLILSIPVILVFACWMIMWRLRRVFVSSRHHPVHLSCGSHTNYQSNLSDDEKHPEDPLMITSVLVNNVYDDKNPDLIANTYGSMNSRKKETNAIHAADMQNRSSSQIGHVSAVDSQNFEEDCPRINGKINPMASPDFDFVSSSSHCSSTGTTKKPSATIIVRNKELELNGKTIQETLLTNKLPESCV